jgi:hypothetical protein
MSHIIGRAAVADPYKKFDKLPASLYKGGSEHTMLP